MRLREVTACIVSNTNASILFFRSDMTDSLQASERIVHSATCLFISKFAEATLTFVLCSFSLMCTPPSFPSWREILVYYGSTAI